MKSIHEACAGSDPGSWGIAAASSGDFAYGYLDKCAAVARAANKPWILEEVGSQVRAQPNAEAVLV